MSEFERVLGHGAMRLLNRADTFCRELSAGGILYRKIVLTSVLHREQEMEQDAYVPVEGTINSRQLFRRNGHNQAEADYAPLHQLAPEIVMWTGHIVIN